MPVNHFDENLMKKITNFEPGQLIEKLKHTLTITAGDSELSRYSR